MAERYQGRAKKSTKKFEVLGRKELAVSLPLPLVEVWEELQPEVEHLTRLAGVKIIRIVIEDEVTRRGCPILAEQRRVFRFVQRLSDAPGANLSQKKKGRTSGPGLRFQEIGCGGWI